MKQMFAFAIRLGFSDGRQEFKIVRFPVGLFSANAFFARSVRKSASQNRRFTRFVLNVRWNLDSVHRMRSAPVVLYGRRMDYWDGRQEWLPAGEEPGSLSKVREEKHSSRIIQHRYYSYVGT